MSTTELPVREIPDQVTDNWNADAPSGGRAVMNRMIKEKATVPLFFAQTLVQSLRDVGYNHTTSALCEHVDNALQAKATEIRVYFRQSGKKPDQRIDIGVYDNGTGMAPSVLKAVTAFGGSLNFGNREGIGRFGMGMKTAALSVSPVMELYSWQEPRAIYNMTLDLEAIGRNRSNTIELPDPSLVSFPMNSRPYSPAGCRTRWTTVTRPYLPRMKARSTRGWDLPEHSYTCQPATA